MANLLLQELAGKGEQTYSNNSVRRKQASNYIFVEQMPHHFTVTAVDSANRIMAMEHVRDHVYGIQWHPEERCVPAVERC